MNYISELQKAIHSLHGCDSKHIKSVHVKEEFQGQVLWDGDVELFKLIDHKTANEAYAWAYLDDKQKAQYVTVLHVGPIDSPEKAVKAMIASRFKAAGAKAQS
ncbi:MAG: hypothetical protein WDM96_03375 [Lacunisphaera sp.]